MLRKDREVSNINAIVDIIKKCKVFRIAMVDDGMPYMVPLNFGIQFIDGKIELYFHSALKGKKIDILKKNSAVCFEMDCEHSVLEDEKACRYGFLFESVIGYGNVEFITEPAQKVIALNHIMRNHTGRNFEIAERETMVVTVAKVVVTEITGKSRKKK